MADPISAINESVFVVSEAGTYRDVVKPTSADAILAREVQIAKNQDLRKRDDKSNTRSVRGTTKGRLGGTWSIRQYLMGSGSPGVEPDNELLWEFTFGAAGVPVASTSVTYALANAIFGNSFNVHSHATDVARLATGCFADQALFEFSGVDEAQVTWSGPCGNVLHAGYDTIASGATSAVQTVTKAENFDIGMIVQVGAQDSSGAGYEIIARDLDAETITLDASITTSTSDVVKPFAPATTTQSVDPVFGTNGSFTITGGPSGMEIRTDSVTLANNGQLRNDGFGQPLATGIGTTDDRDVTLDITAWLTRDLLNLFTDADQQTARQYSIVSGTIAGNILTLAAPQVKLDAPEDTWPNRGDIALQLTGRAVDSAGSEAELSAVWT